MRLKKTLYLNPIEVIVFQNSITHYIESIVFADDVTPMQAAINNQYKLNCESVRDSIRPSTKNPDKQIVTVDYASVTTIIKPALEFECRKIHMDSTDSHIIDTEHTNDLKLFITKSLLNRIYDLELELRHTLS